LVYLAGHKDLFNGEIAGYAMGKRITKNGQASIVLWYRKLFGQFEMKASMESFWGTVKQDLVHHHRYRTRQEAIQDIKKYIEILFNRRRRQARLGFLSPAVYIKNITPGSLQHE
jgi:putative transposase